MKQQPDPKFLDRMKALLFSGKSISRAMEEDIVRNTRGTIYDRKTCDFTLAPEREEKKK